MNTTNFLIITAIVIYLLMMLAVGFRFSKRTSNSEDFYLGGRKMGPLVTAMSAEASERFSEIQREIYRHGYDRGRADCLRKAYDRALEDVLSVI